MDLELFVGKCKREREWSHEQALKQWHLLRADAEVARDEKGPVSFPLRLEIPGWIFGEEGTEQRDGDFEEKRVNIMTRVSGANSEAIQQMRDEVYQGFERRANMPGMNEMLAAMSAAPSSSGLTREDFDRQARRGQEVMHLLASHRPRDGSSTTTPTSSSAATQASSLGDLGACHCSTFKSCGGECGDV